MHPNSRARSAAPRSYTLSELIMVMTVLALAAALLIPHMVGIDSMTVQAAVRLLIADLSFAQSDALANQEFRRVVFYADGTGYCILIVDRFDEVTPADLNDPGVNYVYDPLGNMGRYIVDYTVGGRFEGVSITEATLDGTALSSRPQITYDQLGGTVQTDSSPGIGGSIVLTFKDSSYRITVSPFTGKLTVIEQ